MAVMRVERNHNYTVMANYHLRDSRLSLKAKGLLSVMLSLPVDWDYTLAGLAYISKEGISAIRAAIMELEETGYVVRARVRNGAGQLTETAYTIYEFPQNENPADLDDGSSTPVPSGLIGSLPPQGTPACISPMLEKPTLENPTLDNPTLENRTQQNKDREKKDIENTDTSYPYLSNIHPSYPVEAVSVEPVDADGTSSADPASIPQAATMPSTGTACHDMTVRQQYMSQPTGIYGMRRKLSYEEFVRKVKSQIDYWDLIDGKNQDEIDNILSIMVEVLSASSDSFTISGKKYPADLVHQRFSELNANHIEYVLECMHKCGSGIRNIKSYLVAALFNAPATYNSYYSAAVRHDFAWLRD